MVFALIVFLLASSFYALYVNHESKERSAETAASTNNMHNMFEEVKQANIKILASSLEIILQDTGFKNIYLEKNRTELYDYGQPLFRNMKNRYGITHFYFILPDGIDFVRMHDKEKYGDKITRFTFLKSVGAKEQAEGIELGKTAFALRVVRPYYNGNDLIGYVELGEEIDHFLKILKVQTGNDFAIIVKKQYLGEEDWKSVRETAGLRNNWDDLENYVVIDSTSDDKTCFNPEYVEETLSKGIFTKTKGTGKEDFACGGFSLSDAGNRTVGAVFSKIDLREMDGRKKEFNAYLIVFLIIGSALSLILALFLSRTILRPIVQLRDSAIKIGKGDLNNKINIKSNDEISDLAASFNQMVSDLNESRKTIEDYSRNLEKQVVERTKELTERNEELEKFNKVVVGRELKMIDLKRRIEELEEKLQNK